MSISRFWLRPLLIAIVAAGAGGAFGAVHRCVDPVTQAVTVSDIECPTARAPSPAEVAAKAEAERVAALAKEREIAAARADRQLLEKYPDEAAHDKVRREELDVVIRNIDRTKTRLGQLIAERKPLDEEAKFYVGKPFPPTLKRQVDASEGAFLALADVFRGLEAQLRDIGERYDVERARLRKLWAGAPPGSTGLLATDPAASTPR